MKTCANCKQTKDTAEFGVDRRRPSGRNAYCRACIRVKSAAQRKKLDPEKVRAYRQNWVNTNPDKVRAYQARYRYGFTAEQIAEQLAAQGGRCAICGTDEPGFKQGWNIDHDHATGELRGLLCGACNRGLGMMGDDPDRLEAAARYLRRPPCL